MDISHSKRFKNALVEQTASASQRKMRGLLRPCKAQSEFIIVMVLKSALKIDNYK